MGKYWSVLFGVTMFGCLDLFLIAPFIKGWWLQEDASSHGHGIDFLYYVILIITGFFFVLTEAILVYFMYRYASTDDGKPPRPSPSVFSALVKPIAGVLNEPHKVELAWTIVPAAILLWIAFAQIGVWANIKYQSRFPDFVKTEGKDKVPVVIEVSARQWEWRMRYPSHKRMATYFKGEDKKDFDSFGKKVQFDDIGSIPNELHVVKDRPVLIHLNTRDVIHSLNLPQFRIKQDALPGKVIPVWFIPRKSNATYNDKTRSWDVDPVWEIACAELCGLGHDRMIGRVFVHQNEEDFLKWLKQADDAQNLRKSE